MKKSLFAKSIGLQSADSPGPAAVVSGIREKTEKELQIIEKNLLSPSPVEMPKIEIGSFKPSQVSVTEEEIHTENLKKIQDMGQKEIEESLKEIQSVFTPSTIEFLRKRGEKTLKSRQAPQPVKDLEEKELGSLLQASNKTCLHLPVTDSFLDTVRYDFSGQLVQTYKNGVWQGECQGYTLRESVQMFRSSIPSQRILALDFLMSQLDSNFSQKIEFLIENCDLAKALVFLLTDKNLNIQVKIFQVLKKVFSEHLKKNLSIQRDFFFPAVESKANFFLAKDLRTQKNIWEEEEFRNYKGFNQEGGVDFIVDLFRFGILDILNKSDKEEVYEILLSMCLHSVSACYLLVRHEIFWKILKAVPVSYEILNVLARSSLPAAFKIAKNLPDRFLPDLLTEKSSIKLLYSLACHGQVFDARAVLIEKAQEGEELVFLAASRQVLSSPNSELTAMAEIGYFKYVSDWKNYAEKYDLLANSVDLVNSFVLKELKVSFDLAGLREALESMALGLDFGGLQVFVSEEKIVLNDLEKFFYVRELEEGVCKKIQLFNRCLEGLVVLRKKGVGGSGCEGVRKVLEKTSDVLKKMLKFGTGHVAKIVCYRLKDFVQSLVLGMEYLNDYNEDLIFTVLFFLSSYDEAVLIGLFRKLFSTEIPFFQGYANSEKNLSLSIACYEKSCKISSYFLGLNENPFLPLPYDWLFAPLPSCDKETCLVIFGFVAKLGVPVLDFPVNQVIADINMFFIRKDIDYIVCAHLLDKSLVKVIGSPFFSQGVNQSKNSVLNTVKDFIANSYLEKTYTQWVLSFLTDRIDLDIFQDILDEIDPLFTRIEPVIKSQLIGESSNYTRLLQKLRTIS